tara:strand:+ start:169 stop:348 length:180 start_codon:yes stop_codon:yes gene_type:complete
MEKFTVEKTVTVTLTHHEIITLIIGVRLELKDDVEEYGRELASTRAMLKMLTDMKDATV